MRRGPKPAKSKEAKPSVGRQSPKDEAARVRDLEKRLAEALKREDASTTSAGERLFVPTRLALTSACSTRRFSLPLAHCWTSTSWATPWIGPAAG